LTGRRYDIAIAGAGPAGSAAALTLRRRYPAISVVLLEGSQFDAPRVGEVLSPAAAGLLAELGVAEAFEAEGFRRVYGAAVSWGRPVLAESPHLFTFHGPGWHLDRARFDALLARAAERSGAELRCGARVGGVERMAEGWRLQVGSETVESRFAIDATGRAATLARAAGAHVVGSDRLTAFSCFLGAGDDDSLTIIEAVEDGWWYSGALDGGSRVVAFLTDADIGRALDLARRECWLNQLRRTSFLRRVEGPILHGPIVRSAMSQHLEPVCGPDWLAAGEAAMALDPLSGQGIVAALRSGIFAAYAAGDGVSGGDSEGLARCRRLAECTRTQYERTRTAYYAEERRWSDREFWKRRRNEAER
jgi:flavin-dependent dehydrogenase